MVTEHYRTVELSPEAADALTGMIEDIFDRIDAESEAQRRDLGLDVLARSRVKPVPTDTNTATEVALPELETAA